MVRRHCLCIIRLLQNFFANVKVLGHELRGSGSRCNDELEMDYRNFQSWLRQDDILVPIRIINAIAGKVMPYLLTLSAFCDNVRDMARERKPHVDFLKLSDKLLWRILGCLWTINMIVKPWSSSFPEKI
ncbi:hypothetical protein BC936DRAFT_146502 [Jimgerdemannia flammicorona]|uniref:Uncharacterized protein n=1 Tax=Jimgerdemannia flammicorona TaxID=994334 RepID=A0A433D7F8_9FUNG|nr:hypothetical protein BC936DRAFT_146502 [Jimgerdemannia flammicorona]